MTIRRKLYLGFGAILAIMLALFVVNILTVLREHNARSAAAATLNDVQTIENIRFQMMENRLFLENYLLSGDLRDEEKANKGVATLQALRRDG
jgi:CHASE3 domain sensor protein